MNQRLSTKLSRQGKEGEAQVSSILHCLGYEYYVFDNVLLNLPHGGSAQIDHVVVSPYGIFVIETKSHKGTLYGCANQLYWDYIVRKGGIEFRNKMYSPYMQNQGHMNALMEDIGLPFTHMRGFIVFTSPTVDLSAVDCQSVVTLPLLSRAIHSYNRVIMSPQAVSFVCASLSHQNRQNPYQDKKHVAYAKKQSEKHKNRWFRY